LGKSPASRAALGAQQLPSAIGIWPEKRLKLERERPEVSHLIGAVSWVVLVIALVYEVPQLIALVAKTTGADFDSPFTLPGAANFALGIAALVAAVERALRFKTNRWLLMPLQPSCLHARRPGATARSRRCCRRDR
jgi:hypothetical protein